MSESALRRRLRKPRDADAVVPGQIPAPLATCVNASPSLRLCEIIAAAIALGGCWFFTVNLWDRRPRLVASFHRDMRANCFRRIGGDVSAAAACGERV